MTSFALVNVCRLLGLVGIAGRIEQPHLVPTLILGDRKQLLKRTSRRQIVFVVNVMSGDQDDPSLVDIVEHSHFRIAAEELLVSQPTLAQQMKDLEKELGCPLFERAGRGVRLTQAGTMFADYARRALNVLDEGQTAIGEFDALLRGRLRIAVVQTVGTYLMPSNAASFSQSHPWLLATCRVRLKGDPQLLAAFGRCFP